jgi:hypothetical protein
VPPHKELKRGTLTGIMTDAGIDRGQLRALSKWPLAGVPPPRTPMVLKNILPIGSSTPCGTPT